MRRLGPIFSIIIFTLASCVFDYSIYWEDSDYAVVEIENKATSLNRKLESGNWVQRVAAKIIAAGSDARYVVAARHNTSADTIEYYYLEKAKDNAYADPETSVIGPLSVSEFAGAKRQLSLPLFEDTFLTNIDLDTLNALSGND